MSLSPDTEKLSFPFSSSILCFNVFTCEKTFFYLYYSSTLSMKGVSSIEQLIKFIKIVFCESSSMSIEAPEVRGQQLLVIFNNTLDVIYFKRVKKKIKSHTFQIFLGLIHSFCDPLSFILIHRRVNALS